MNRYYKGLIAAVVITYLVGCSGNGGGDEEAPPTAHTLTITLVGNGQVSVTPVGTSCGTNCYAYTKGTQVALTAAPASGNKFSDWQSGCTGSGTQCNLTINDNTSVTASFKSLLAKWGEGVWGEMLWQ